MVHGKLGETQQDVGQPVQIRRRLTADTRQQLEPADSPNHLQRLGGGEWRDPKADIAEDLDIAPTEPEHQERTKPRVNGDAKDHLVTTACHLLHQESLARMTGRSQRDSNLIDSALQLLLVPQVDLDRSHVALVDDIGCHGLDHDGVTDLGGSLRHQRGVLNCPPGSHRNAIELEDLEGLRPHLLRQGRPSRHQHPRGHTQAAQRGQALL